MVIFLVKKKVSVLFFFMIIWFWLGCRVFRIIVRKIVCLRWWKSGNCWWCFLWKVVVVVLVILMDCKVLVLIVGYFIFLGNLVVLFFLLGLILGGVLLVMLCFLGVVML